MQKRASSQQHGRRAFCASLLALVVPPWLPTPAQAFLVTDLANLAQAILNALENAKQTVQAIRDYRNQLQQYQELVRNTLAVPVEIWDRIHDLQESVKGLMNDLRNYRSFLRDIEAWLNRLGDLEYYRQAKCYGAGTQCVVSDWENALRLAQEEEGISYQMRKRTMDEMVVSLDRNAESMDRSVRELERMQQQSHRSRGNLEALQAGNELASAQVEQMLQMRASMAAYYRIIMIEKQAALAREARDKARSERYWRHVYKPGKYQGQNPWTFTATKGPITGSTSAPNEEKPLTISPAPTGPASPPPQPPNPAASQPDGLDPWNGTTP